MRLRSPAAWQQHLGVLRGQPGEGGCSLRWWQRWQRRRTAAAAGRCRLSPADWRCAMLSGHPAEVKEEKMTFGPEFRHVFFFFFLPDTMIDNEAQCSNLGLGLHFGSVLEQVSDYVCLACPGCHVESCLTSLKDTKETVISGSFSYAKM